MDFDGDHGVRIQKIHSRADHATIVGSLVRTQRDTLRHVIAEHFHTIDIRDNSRGIENTKVVGSQVGEGTHFLAEVLGSRDGLGPVSTNVAIPVGYDRDVRPVGNTNRLCYSVDEVGMIDGILSVQWFMRINTNSNQ